MKVAIYGQYYKPEDKVYVEELFQILQKNNIDFVLLAGGKSERMGVAKGLLKYQQTYWILEQLHRISKTNIKDVYIGLGFNFEHYFN